MLLTGTPSADQDSAPSDSYPGIRYMPHAWQETSSGKMTAQLDLMTSLVYLKRVPSLAIRIYLP